VIQLASPSVLPSDVIAFRLKLLFQATLWLTEVSIIYLFIRTMTAVVDARISALRSQVFSVCINNNLAFFDRYNTDINRVLTSDFQDLRSNLWNNLSSDRGISSFLKITIGVLVCFLINPVIALCIFCFLLPLVSYMSARFTTHKIDLDEKYSKSEGVARFRISQAFDSLQTVKAYTGEAFETEALSKAFRNTLGASDNLSRARAKSESFIRFTIYISVIAIYILGGQFVVMGTLTMSKFLQLSSFMWILLFSFIGSIYTLNDLQTVLGCIRRIYSLLDTATAAKIESERLLSSYATGGIISENGPNTAKKNTLQFHNVIFTYPSRQETGVLKGISFEILPGSTVALVGPSGAGKSTIANLIVRFYQPSSGKITLNGVDIQSMDRDRYLNDVAYVDQDPRLFDGTISSNISYGTNTPTMEVEDAARAANAHEFIMALPQGYDTVVEKGSKLSGGQKQRICIARAIYRNASLLILDEYTSALDAKSESLIQASIDNLLRQNTISVLIIAHRLTTIRNADNILYVADGTIVESGTYDELMDTKESRFRQMVASTTKVIMNNN